MTPSTTRKKRGNELERAVILGAIESLKKGWGADCKVPDVNDGIPLPKTAKEYKKWLDVRCQSCRAKETIKFLEEHLSYL